MKRKAHYPVTYTQIKTFTASSGALSIMHSSILVAFVKNSAFVGSASKNAHQFHQYDTTNFVLYVKGVHNPSEPLTMNCSSPVAATRVYEILF
jgi:hypothetical protein